MFRRPELRVRRSEENVARGSCGRPAGERAVADGLQNRGTERWADSRRFIRERRNASTGPPPARMLPPHQGGSNRRTSRDRPRLGCRAAAHEASEGSDAMATRIGGQTRTGIGDRGRENAPCRDIQIPWRSRPVRYVVSDWSTSATDRCAPMLTGTAVSTAMTSTVTTTTAVSDKADGMVVLPLCFGAS